MAQSQARDSSEGEVEVFFVDLGQVEVVTLSNTRKLEPCFSVQPLLVWHMSVGQSWCKEATTLFKKLTTFSQCLTAKVITSSPNQRQGLPAAALTVQVLIEGHLRHLPWLHFKENGLWQDSSQHSWVFSRLGFLSSFFFFFFEICPISSSSAPSTPLLFSP